MSTVPERIDQFFSRKGFNLIAFGIIAVLILIAYSNTFHADFHFDDNPSIVENYQIKQTTWNSFLSMFNGTRPI
ncbi:MAG TPA: hypothetical protein VK654_10640, partial [Nitrospirota bacterium]|nr:hypothetical protein [Nitrospirota bacterium]